MVEVGGLSATSTMGCGASKSAKVDRTVPEAQQSNAVPDFSASAPSPHKLEPIPTSSLKTIEFGLVKGLEYGPKTAPAMLVVQVMLRCHSAGIH